MVHAKLTVSALARFHGLGMALKQHKPNVFENIKQRAKGFSVNLDRSVPYRFFFQIFRKDPTMSPHYDYLKKALTQDSRMISATPIEPWSTIIHNDSWVNNIMFRNKEDVKFVDFQHFQFHSPMMDLVFCLMQNLNDEVMESYFDYLLDHYYEKLMEVLRRMKCDTSEFRRRDFDERLKIDSFLQFQQISFVLKVMTTDVEENDDNAAESVLMTNQENPLLARKLRRIVLKYAEKGWIHDQATLKRLKLD